MARFKDWKEGEYRIKFEVITAKGSRLEMYIPFLSEKTGGAVTALMIKVLQRAKATVSYSAHKNEKAESLELDPKEDKRLARAAIRDQKAGERR